MMATQMGLNGCIRSLAVTGTYEIFALLLIVILFVISLFGIVFYLVKKKMDLYRKGEIAEHATNLPQLPQLIAREAQTMPPQDQLEKHRHEIAIENRARDEACRIAADFLRNTGSTAKGIWILAGPGPLGAVAMAMARHLQALGFEPIVQLQVFVNKLAPDAAREHKTLAASRIPILETAVARPRANCRLAIIGVDETSTNEREREHLQKLLERCEADGLDADMLQPFNTHYVGPVPELNDVTISVPDIKLTREESRLIDSLAQQHYGILSAALMENAGYWAAREIYLIASEIAVQLGRSAPEIAIVCGKGNNGGDGMVIARHLLQWGMPAQTILLGEKNRTSDDTGKNLKLLEACGTRVTAMIDHTQWPGIAQIIETSHLVVDAILGTGMQGDVRGEAEQAVEAILKARKHGAYVVAVDTPSGLDCNSGMPLGCCVQADLTVTFAGMKSGFFKGQAPELCGRIVVADIGIPRALYRKRMQSS